MIVKTRLKIHGFNVLLDLGSQRDFAKAKHAAETAVYAVEQVLEAWIHREGRVSVTTEEHMAEPRVQ